MSSPAVLAEIARLESEIGRIQRELEALKKSVGAASVRRTQAFPSPIETAQQLKNAPTCEMPAVTQSEPPLGKPQPSVPVASETIPTLNATKSDRRVQQRGRTGLTEHPPAANPTPTHRNANHDPAAGRYEYVGEGRSKRR
jgi:hypothetical protein